MRVVVMDRERAEPLTVVEIGARLMREVQKGRRYVEMAVPQSFADWFTMADKFADAMPHVSALKTVRLSIEPVMTSDGYGGSRPLFWFAVPHDEELALLLRAAFLPGQLTELRRREMREWFRGAVGAPPPDAGSVP